MATALRPEGRFTRAASHTNAAEAAHAISLVLFILKCQVSAFLVAGRVPGLPISPALIIVIVLSVLAASPNLFICSAVKTCGAFCRSPEPYTIISGGAVM